MISNQFKKNLSAIKKAFWSIFPIIFGIAIVSFVSLIFRNSAFDKIFSPVNRATISESISSEKNVSVQKIDEKPKYFYLNNANDKPKVAAAAYLVGDLNTGEVILSKNQDQKFPIASISKLMTALVGSEIKDPEGLALVSRKALSTYGSNGNFRVGERIKTGDLLYPLLLESSNDAAEIIAEHFGRDIFIKKMNQEADILKMSSTSYDDPSGLSEKNRSSVADIFKLTGYLNQENPEILAITRERSFSNKTHRWSNISHFLGKEGYIGGKSGYTDAAKQTVVSLFSLPLGKSGERPIAITLLQSPDRTKDVDSIIKYLKKNIYYGGASDSNTDWVALKVGSPDIKDPNFITLGFAGDIMLDRGVKNSVIKNFNNDYSKLFEKPDLNTALKKSDIFFANLEGPASDKGSDGGNLYSFRMDPAVIPALSGAGINVLSVGNNHIGDFGRPAFIDTLERLNENEILYTGGGINSTQAEKPAIIEKYGMKIGYLGISDVGESRIEADRDRAGILSANNPRLDEIIKNGAKLVDYLVVYFHFGEEYEEKHNERQEFLAHQAIDDGAKIVIGSNPHVIEDFEAYKDGFIAYSLGNFIFDQAFSEKTMQGMILNIKLERDGNMTVRKDIVKLNQVFQPDSIIKGRDEEIKLEENKIKI